MPILNSFTGNERRRGTRESLIGRPDPNLQSLSWVNKTSLDKTGSDETAQDHRRARMGIFETCAHPGCRSGWIHLLRSRSAPVFEGGWTCSAECTAARVAAAVRR